MLCMSLGQQKDRQCKVHLHGGFVCVCVWQRDALQSNYGCNHTKSGRVVEHGQIIAKPD
jgi:hypothetical protein